MDPPDSYELIGLVQTVLAYHYVVYSADWQLPDALPPLLAAPQDSVRHIRTHTCMHLYTNTRTYADGRTYVHLEIYTGIYSCTFTHTIKPKRIPIYCLAGTETAWPRMPLEPVDAGKPREGSNPPYVRFHPFPKFPRNFGI